MDFRATLASNAAGDAAARRRLLELFYPVVSNLVHAELQRSFRRNHRWILPLFSTGDVVHDVLLRVLEGGVRIPAADEAAVGRYLAAAVSHRLISAVRHHHAGRRDVRRERRRAADPTAAEPTAAGPTAGTAGTAFLDADLVEQIEMFRAELATMGERDRRLIDLRLVAEAPYDEIAAELGFASANAARKALLRAQARLAVKLRGRGLDSGSQGR